ncbi:MAG: hypothetical protein JNJ94_04150, partial [Chlorobi bacterium]|nr:hypothetical protein [Chlorobiota bacterium]
MGRIQQIFPRGCRKNLDRQEFAPIEGRSSQLDVDTVRSYSVSDSIRLRFNEAVRVAAPTQALTLRDTAGRIARFRLV